MQQLWESHPPGFPWRLGSFCGIKIFLGCAAAVGNIFHACCRRLLGAPPPGKKSPCTAGPVPHILGIYIYHLINTSLDTKAGGGGFFFEKKSRKKRKNTQKIPLFFGGIASRHPDDPLSIKLTQHSSIYGLGACFLWAKIPIGCTGICRDQGWAKTGRSAPTIPFS